MKLVPIFVDNKTKEGLYSIKYNKQKRSEWDRLIDVYGDTSYVSEYCYNNKNHIECVFFRQKNLDIDRIISQVLAESEFLFKRIEEFSTAGFELKGDNLQMLFRPLYNSETNVPVLQKTKAIVKKDHIFRTPIFRLYGIRIDKNTFVITGAAIKLTKGMDGHIDTKEELRKIEEVRKFLIANEFECIEDIVNYFEDES